MRVDFAPILKRFKENIVKSWVEFGAGKVERVEMRKLCEWDFKPACLMEIFHDYLKEACPEN